MKRKSTSNASKAADVPYDPSKRAAVKAFWSKAVAHTGIAELRRRRGQRGPQRAPTKKLVSLRLSREVIKHFKATGAGWQTRIDETLKSAIEK